MGRWGSKLQPWGSLVHTVYDEGTVDKKYFWKVNIPESQVHGYSTIELFPDAYNSPTPEKRGALAP